MKLAIITAVLLLSACAENTLPEREWARFIEERDCYQGIGMVWKCLYPTPTWWIRKEPE